MNVLIVYVSSIIWFSSEFIKAENTESRSYSFAEVYDENPTLAKAQAIMGNLRKDPDEALTCGQFIKSRGFGLERHYVITFDGYILQVHRIINPYATANRKCLKPVLLSHGLLTSCACWLVAGSDGHIKPWINGNPPNDNSTSLAFLLANEGYDVWLINIRGTTYSTNHTYLNPIDPKFWDYTFQDISLYDIPAVVEYIKKETGRKQITVVGHSQGTTQQLIGMSVKPESEKNYDLVILLAPLGFIGNIASIVGVIPHEPVTNMILNALPSIPFPPAFASFVAVLGLLCQSQLVIPFCVEILSSISGSEAQQLNTSRISVFIGGLDRTSLKNIVHYGQSEHTDHFGFFNHGEAKNLEIYGSPEAPIFPLHRINARKIVLINALNDALVTKNNNQKLINSFNGSVLVHHIIRDPLWGHTSFVLGAEQYKYVGKVVLDLIRKYGSD